MGVKKEQASRLDPIELEDQHTRMVLYQQIVPSLGVCLAGRPMHDQIVTTVDRLSLTEDEL